MYGFVTVMFFKKFGFSVQVFYLYCRSSPSPASAPRRRCCARRTALTSTPCCGRSSSTPVPHMFRILTTPWPLYDACLSFIGAKNCFLRTRARHCARTASTTGATQSSGLCRLYADVWDELDLKMNAEVEAMQRTQREAGNDHAGPPAAPNRHAAAPKLTVEPLMHRKAVLNDLRASNHPSGCRTLSIEIKRPPQR